MDARLDLDAGVRAPLAASRAPQARVLVCWRGRAAGRQVAARRGAADGTESTSGYELPEVPLKRALRDRGHPRRELVDRQPLRALHHDDDDGIEGSPRMRTWHVDLA